MSIFGSIKDAIAKYAELYLSLLKVNVIGKTSGLMAYVMFAIICMLLVFCIIILLGFGIVEGFCAMGLERVAAFFATFGLYVVLLFVLISLRRKITRSFANTFIRILTEGDNEKNNKE